MNELNIKNEIREFWVDMQLTIILISIILFWILIYFTESMIITLWGVGIYFVIHIPGEK